jgi:hypothetical protein
MYCWERLLSQNPLKCFMRRQMKAKQILRVIELKEMAVTKLVLSIDVSSSSRKIAFGILKSYKTKDYEDYHAVLAWEKLKKKYDPVSAPSFVKTNP